ncbi:DnaJ family domain-containing protein [Nocardia sp. NPDC004711]
MTERKSPGLSFESWIDKQVREATERGEFDNLKGAGQPIPPGAADEDWWLRNYLKREGLGGDALLPESIILRRERERIQETVRDMFSEQDVRATVASLNDRIVHYLRMPTGPHVPIGPLKVDDVVETWRAERKSARPPRVSAPLEPIATERSWWRGLFRR